MSLLLNARQDQIAPLDQRFRKRRSVHLGWIRMTLLPLSMPTPGMRMPKLSSCLFV
jgi:hypothetical protein